jgi:hypothetical protein
MFRGVGKVVLDVEEQERAKTRPAFGWWSPFRDAEGNRFALTPAGQ